VQRARESWGAFLSPFLPSPVNNNNNNNNNNNQVILALALGAPSAASALTARQELAAAVNAAGSTWTAAASPKDLRPLGSSKHTYGVKEESRAEFEALAAIPGSGFVMAPKVSPEVAASIPASFSSAEAWPACAKVINDIRDQSNCGVWVYWTGSVGGLDGSGGLGGLKWGVAAGRRGGVSC